MANRKLIVEFVGDSRDLERKLNSSTVAVNKFGASTTGVAAKTDSAFKKIQGGLAGAFVGGVAASAAVNGIKTVVSAASDLNEQITKNQQVFGSSAASVQAWSKTTAQAIGVSETAALEATGTFGNLFRAIGVTGPQAADTSKRLVQLAADLASFNNASPEDTLLAIRSGLVGEAEPLRRYGVLLSEARVQQVAMAETGKDNAKALTVQEKAAARIAIIFKDTTAAQGDFARTSGGLANQQRILAAEVKDLEANLGTLLLPTMQKITGSLVVATGAAVDLTNALTTLGKVKIPEINIGFGFTIGGGDIAAGVGSVLLRGSENIPGIGPLIHAVDLVVQTTREKAEDEAKLAASHETTILANTFGQVLGGMVTNALNQASTTATPVDKNKVKGFGSGLVPKDLFGPIITEIPKAIQEAILDAQNKGSDPAIRAALVRAQKVLLDQVTRPDLTQNQRIAAKQALKSVNDQIAAIDSAAASATAAAASKAASAASKAATKAKQAATAAKQKQRARFDLIIANLTTAEDAAELTTRFNDNIKIENKIQKAILKQIKVEGRTAELVGKLNDSRDKEAAAVKGRRLAKQFKILGLGPTGEEAIPGVKSLDVQFDRITKQVGAGTIKLGGKLTKQLAGAGTLLKKTAGKLAPEIASAIQDIFDAITGTIDKNTKTTSPLTKGTSLNVGKILDGLGLGRDMEKELRARLSSFNSAGKQLAGSTRPTGSFGGGTFAQKDMVINITTMLDGQVVAQTTSKHQVASARRNPWQKRGPNRSVWGF